MNFLLNSAVAFYVGALPVRWYGLIISAAMCVGIFLAYREAERQHQNGDHLINMMLLLLPSAIIGARLYYVLFRLDYYLAHPDRIIATWEGGLAIHGGVILGAAAVWLYCHMRRQDFFRWADILAPSLALGQAIGRWGNFANHEAYGPAIDPAGPWSWIPLQVYADGAYHHPCFLYESVWNLLVFVFLLCLLRRPHRIGSAFAWYLILYSVGRFFIETLRTDSLMIGPFRTAMLVSMLGVAAGAVLLYALSKKRAPVDVAADAGNTGQAPGPGKSGKTAANDKPGQGKSTKRK